MGEFTQVPCPSLPPKGNLPLKGIGYSRTEVGAGMVEMPNPRLARA